MNTMMRPDDWRPILKAMASVYPDGCNCQTIRRLTGLPPMQIKRTVRVLTQRGFIRIDAANGNAAMLQLNAAGMAVACDQTDFSPCDARAPELDLESTALKELGRCRAAGGLGPA